MKRFWKVVGWLGLAMLVVAGYAAYRIGWGRPFTIDLLATRQAVLFLVRNPELFTQIGAIDGTLLDRHSGKLALVGVAKRDDDYSFAEKRVGEVRRLDPAKLRRQDRITFDILLDLYGAGLAFRRFDWLSSEGLCPISPMFGRQVALSSFLQTQHVVKNEKTARNHVARLEATGDKLDALTAEMQRQEKASLVLPSALLESQGLVAGTVAERMTGLHEDPRFLFPNTDEGRKQVLARYRQILGEVNARMPEYFRSLCRPARSRSSGCRPLPAAGGDVPGRAAGRPARARSGSSSSSSRPTRPGLRSARGST